ncbi:MULTISPECIES: molybdopterin-guanine dinucleotide biosynthesis protein B [Helicobacter]|uniref:molybdopterin-guanine dinucleotide biosynthesis protein B n=1 Tax=Helicobacter TaxID=209 RepID=UPI00068A1D17|nr:molybdopterin-guanine dinucleotide biosynthesis protein B [Helicobacter sp. MIT 03-1616]TLD89359.1 molybdopterin-guanine dinucleotide biosynthesis protein B [Helicobacter sp. MIT 03-1616]
MTHNAKLMHTPIIFAFSGKSNSGKTTLICKLCEYLKPKAKVAVIKHDPKDKAHFDTRGKDSYEFFQRSNAVAILSPTRTILQIKHDEDSQNAQEIESNAFYAVLEQFKNYDYIFIEGLKTLPFPRIVVARGQIESSYIPYAQAFAIDESVNNTHILPPALPILNLNDVAQIAAFINAYSKSASLKGE